MLTSFLLLACAAGTQDSASSDTGCEPTTWYADADGDLYGDSSSSTDACTQPSGFVANPSDCDDTAEAVYPGAPELCNGIDDDCDDEVDPSTSVDAVQCFMDADGDGYGDPGVSYDACVCAEEYVENALDCNDDDPDSWPGAEETWYDGVDQDCAGLEDEYDVDGDGYDWGGAGGGDCADSDPDVHPDAVDLCADGVDQDCSGADATCGLEGLLDSDTDSWLRIERDPETHERAWFGVNIVHGGDADGDGLPELVACVVRTVASDEGVDYVRFEPALAGGDDVVQLDDVVDAHWNVPTGEEYWTSSAYSSAPTIVAGQDLDGDGQQDTMFSTGATGNLGERSRVDLWYGPASGTMSLDDAVTLTHEASSLELGSALSVLQPAEHGDDWVIATLVVPDDPKEGELHPTVALLTAAQFDGSTGVGEATTVWTDGSREPQRRVEVGDVDGDGLADLVLAASHQAASGEPAGRVWIVLGPVSEDRFLDEADVVLDGASMDDHFGSPFALVDDPVDRDRKVVVAVTPSSSTEDPRTRFFRLDGIVDGYLSVDDAFGAVLPGENSRHWTGQPADVGDIDGDGVVEVGLPSIEERTDAEDIGVVSFLEVPHEGVVTADDYDARVLEGDDERVGDFGAAMLGGVDFDMDGEPDVLIGVPGWNGWERDGDDSFGRVVIFSGDSALDD